MKKPPSVSPAQWRERYEALRQHVVERRQILGADPLGLVMLLTRGVGGWMESWWEAPAEAAKTSALAPSLKCPTTPPWQEQLTRLLAQMAAQHL